MAKQSHGCYMGMNIMEVTNNFLKDLGEFTGSKDEPTTVILLN